MEKSPEERDPRVAGRDAIKDELVRADLGDIASKPGRVKPQAVALVKDGKPSIARDIDSYLAETGFGEWR